MVVLNLNNSNVYGWEFGVCDPKGFILFPLISWINPNVLHEHIALTFPSNERTIYSDLPMKKGTESNLEFFSALFF